VRLGRDERCATVAVADEGPGIDPDEHERIFEQFYRVGTGLVHDAQGSGLGLAIVKHVVEAHDGAVEVASRPGAGSTFTIRLPFDDGGGPCDDAGGLCDQAGAPRDDAGGPRAGG
jgi:signal transduction histidine kinase